MIHTVAGFNYLKKINLTNKKALTHWCERLLMVWAVLGSNQ